MTPFQALSTLVYNILLLLSVLGGLLATIVYATMGFSQFLGPFEAWVYDLLPILNVFYVMTLLLGLAALGDKHPKEAFGLTSDIKPVDIAHPYLSITARLNNTLLWVFILGWVVSGQIFFPTILGLAFSLTYPFAWMYSAKKKHYPKSVDESSS